MSVSPWVLAAAAAGAVGGCLVFYGVGDRQ